MATHLPIDKTDAAAPLMKKVDSSDTTWLWVLVLVAVTFLAYAPVWRAGFVWDDETLITGNPLIKAGDGLYRFWFTTEPADYYPVTNTLGWLEWRLWGNRALGYHVVNVLLHVVNAALVWTILRRLTIPGAWLAAAVFAVHPVNVATVAWVSEQKNTLSMLFFLVAILSYLRFDEQGCWRWYGFSLGAFLLALLSKAAIVMLPIVLLGCVWWRRGRIKWKDLLCSLPFFILSAILGLIAIRFQFHHRLALGLPPSSVSWASHLAVAGSVPWFYLSTTMWPVDLTVIYPKWQINDSHWSSYVLGVVLVYAFGVFWWKRNTWGRPLLFGFGYFVTMLFPVLGFFNQTFYRYASVADHWQYYSIIGPIALVAAFTHWIGGRLSDRGQYWRRILAAGLLVVLAMATGRRVGVYTDSVTLWQDNVVRYPDAYGAHQNLGFLLAQEGKLREAIGQFAETVRLRPDIAESHYGLGSALAQQGRTPEAIREFEHALRIKPNDAQLQNNLANTLVMAGRVSEALPHYQQALVLKPGSAEMRDNLGMAFAQLGRMQEAMEQWERALQIKPDYAEAHYDLGLALERTGRIADAIAHFEQALKSDPNMVEAQHKLARLRPVR